jgi:hypothetical protein
LRKELGIEVKRRSEVNHMQREGGKPSEEVWILEQL